MIGNETLNEIIHFRKETTSNMILNKLHQRVLETLKQKESQVNDGMEMTLCVIPPQTQHLHFSGARNSLIYIQDGQLQEIKGDRLPIGGFQKEKERNFTLHTVPVLNSDGSHIPFYIYSDGFQDQFGGPKNRKFMSRRFKDLLFEIHKLPMKKQESIINLRFNEWKGEEEQVDDILVMGFRANPALL